MCCVVLFHCQINCVMQLFCLSDAVSCNLVNYFDFFEDVAVFVAVKLRFLSILFIG